MKLENPVAVDTNDSEEKQTIKALEGFLEQQTRYTENAVLEVMRLKKIIEDRPAPVEAWAVKGPVGQLRVVAPGWSKFECICDFFGFPTTGFPLKRIGTAWKNARSLGFRAVRVEVREVGE